MGFDVVLPYYEELTKTQVEEAHKNGMKVIPWTINSKEDMDTMYGVSDTDTEEGKGIWIVNR